jgi:hypothetical protein
MGKTNLKNYTSEVSSDKSLARIERLLVSAGAKRIMKEWNDKEMCCGISFQLSNASGVVSYQLPAKIEAVFNILYSKYSKPTVRSEEICWEQAERTAWKIICDWVEIQIAMIEMEQAKLAQVFLPYMHNGKQSFYEKMLTGDRVPRFLNGID